MRICIIGKYPPIEGGVSTRTFRTAHALARHGHQVEMVTNANEVTAPFRMFMDGDDWARCEAADGAGRVRVHWTQPADRSQFHIPMSNPFTAKLVAGAVAAFEQTPFDVVFSYYMQPYAMAGHLVAEITGRPHVIKTAGSDAGRLWRHDGFRHLYDHLFRSAARIVAGGPVAEKLFEIGVPAARVDQHRDFALPLDEFSPDGPELDLDRLLAAAAANPDFAGLAWGGIPEGLPCIGVYGKIEDSKGVLPLLEALARLKREGRHAGLLVMGHERPRRPAVFRQRVTELGLGGRVAQIPFLPHWRVPEFIRRCLAVCCLEQDFPIAIHAPLTPREVLACGTPLVTSASLVAKLPFAERLVHGYNCVLLRDAHSPDALSHALGAMLDDPARAASMGARAHGYVAEMQQTQRFPDRLEQTLRRAISGAVCGADDVVPDRFRLSRLAVAALPSPWRERCGLVDGAAGVRAALAVLEAAEDRDQAARAAAALRLDLLIHDALGEAPEGQEDNREDGSLGFRLRAAPWALDDGEIGGLVPQRISDAPLTRFRVDANALLEARRTGIWPQRLQALDNHVILLRAGGRPGLRTLVIDPTAASLLASCNGTLTVDEIEKKSDEGAPGTLRRLFELGLIALAEPAMQPAGKGVIQL